MQHTAVRQPVYILLGTILSLSFISLLSVKKIFPPFIKEINIFSELKKDAPSTLSTEKIAEKNNDNSTTEINTKVNPLDIQNFGLQNNNYALFKNKLQKIGKIKKK